MWGSGLLGSGVMVCRARCPLGLRCLGLWGVPLWGLGVCDVGLWDVGGVQSENNTKNQKSIFDPLN